MQGLRAGGNAQITRGDVLDEEGKRRDEHRGPPFELRSVGARPAAGGGGVCDELPERGRVSEGGIREEREVGGPAAVRRDLPPAGRERSIEIVESDELEITCV